MTVKRQRYIAMQSLTDGMDEATKEAVVNFERLLCVIFCRQFSGGSRKCYSLRKAIVDYTKAVQNRSL